MFVLRSARSHLRYLMNLNRREFHTRVNLGNCYLSTAFSETQPQKRPPGQHLPVAIGRLDHSMGLAERSGRESLERVCTCTLGTLNLRSYLSDMSIPGLLFLVPRSWERGKKVCDLRKFP